MSENQASQSGSIYSGKPFFQSQHDPLVLIFILILLIIQCIDLINPRLPSSSDGPPSSPQKKPQSLHLKKIPIFSNPNPTLPRELPNNNPTNKSPHPHLRKKSNSTHLTSLKIIKIIYWILTLSKISSRLSLTNF